ncbi:MAG: cation diffusion facilitator CzcD-associated flavoprotein CzcO [Candidatus Poriferisodalaceae bacterium]|jgi:cation diffusion facilitator CzcD-associated flavoprotein CzcO|tara:strand:+ start:22170 stop:23681 length:1512 start_codon:yes stop_codon:yes gene_type:complete
MGNSKTGEHSAASATNLTEHFDVLIVGAGISGIGGAYHLQDQCPDKSFAVLEAQDSFGGTWRTHKYPGIRSDSDLYTFGYRFKPWTSAPIATAAEITKYMGEVIEENELASHIRYGHAISSASWSTEEKMWLLSVTVSDSNEQLNFSCNFLWMCQGYYRHSEGYTPSWPGVQDFQGDIIHPQTWPENFDYSGKKVVVIGSGATAATLIPAMAEKCSHITMLQRSPTYFATGRNAIEVADMLRELEIPEEWVHEIVRKKILLEQEKIAQMSREHPELVKAELFKGIKQFLPDDYDIDQHFTPSYRPWHQRIAFVPDGDLFKRIADGTASVVTDEIQTFQSNGILLKSGDVLEADVIITATGFNLNVLGDIDFDIDSEPLNFSESITYRGAMFTGIPNMAWVFGYFRASWTLRADLIGDFVCRLLNHMEETGSSVAVPRLREEDKSMKLLPWVDPEDFNPGYLQRSVHLLPQQGDTDPWRHAQDYWTEKDLLPIADLDDGALSFR